MENIITNLQKEVVDAITQGQKVYCGYYFRPKDEVCVLIESPKFLITLNDNFYDFVYGGVYYSFKITQKEKVFMKEKLFNNIFLAEDIFFKIENDELSLLDFDQFWREL